MTFQRLWVSINCGKKETANTAAKADNNGFAARHAYLILSPTVKGTFSYRNPIKHIFGFCEDYDKMVYSLKHRLTLVKKNRRRCMFSEEQQLVLEKSVQIKFHGSCVTLFRLMPKGFPFTRLLNQKSRYQQHIEQDNAICYQFLNRQVSHGA